MGKVIQKKIQGMSWLARLFLVLMLIFASVTGGKFVYDALAAGTAGRPHFIAADTSTTSVTNGTPFTVRFKLTDQAGNPITTLPNATRISSIISVTTNTTLTAGTDYTNPTFTHIGSGVYEATLTISNMVANNLYQIYLNVTDATIFENATPNFRASVYVKNGTPAVDMRYFEVQPSTNGDISTTGTYAFKLKFIDSTGASVQLPATITWTAPTAVNQAGTAVGGTDSVTGTWNAGGWYDCVYTHPTAFTSGDRVYIRSDVRTSSTTGGLNNARFYWAFGLTVVASQTNTEITNTQFTTPTLYTTTPTLSTPTAASIASTTATLGATITSNGGATITDSGIVWGTATAPTTADNKVATSPLVTTNTAFTVPVTGLPAGTRIYYRGYATNSAGTSYSTTEGSFYTEPATQASAVTFSNVSQTGMTVNWTRGNGAGVIVLIKSGAAVDSPPVDGTDTGYTANAAFGSGTLLGTGNYVLYKGTGTSVAVTGLTNSTTYNVAVYEYSGTGNDASPALGINYLMTPATGAQATASPCAATIPTALTVGAVTANSVPLTWTAGAGDDSYIIYRDGLQKASGITSASYTDNTAAAGTTYSYTVSGYSNAGVCGSSQTSPATANTLSNTPAAPTVSNVGNGTSLTVSVNGNGNGTATTYAIRINGGAYSAQFVQAGGTIGAGQVWQTAAAWGTTTINGLTGGTTYTFDVIARNGALVQTVYGPTAAKAPAVTLSAVITTCSGCHGNPPVDNPSRVGGTTGQFQGSHNTHSGTGTSQYNFACTTCHTDNSANMAHADGNINMALSPGSYGKGTSFATNNTTFTPGRCYGTYCHTNGTGGTTNSGETRALVSYSSPKWGNLTACTSCHATPPAYASYTGTVVTQGSKANAHLGATHASKTCDTCHDSVATTDGGATYTTTTNHVNGSYTIKASLGYTYNARRGGTCATAGCHGSINWGGKLGCINCHAQSYTRTKGAVGATLAAVTAEFGLAYGHKKTGRGAVTDADCIVCHLEGDSTTKKTSATYHQNGTIDLRDPDGTGEARITDIGGASWSFTRFSTSFAAGTRTSTGHTSNTIANIITQKFCLKCHDNDGAKNTAARVTGGTAWMPWGGSTGYTAQTATNLNGVPVANGLVNVFSQFSTGNSSLHPVRGPRTKDFPTQGRMVAPYNGFTRPGTAGTTSAGIVINCFDCHNNYPTLNYLGKTGLLTLRTNAAHGTSGAAASGGMIRGTFYVAAPTLCGNCHSGYTVTGQHGAGSAMASNTGRTDEGFNGQCSNCHGSKTTAPATAPARPVPAADYHGSNNRLTGTLWPTINARPVAFIRGWSGTAYHRGRALAGTSGYAAGTAQCGGGTCPNGGNVGDGSNRNYTPGGTY